MLSILLSASILSVSPQDSQKAEELIAQFGLRPSWSTIAVDGKATIAQGETIELVGVSNLKMPSLGVWTTSLDKASEKSTTLFWEILNLSIDAKSLYAKDEENRTFALGFRLSPILTKAINIRADEGKTFRPLMAETRSELIESHACIGEARIIGPIKMEKTIDYRLEVPGGEWKTLIEFSLTGESNLKGIEVIKRWKNDAEFVQVNGKEEIVRTRVHFFTITLPEPLRNLDLEVISNDPSEDAAMLGNVKPQHILGEDQSKEFEGKDLFIVPCLNKLNFDRVFTLRARPKRIVEFRGIPLKR